MTTCEHLPTVEREHDDHRAQAENIFHDVPSPLREILVEQAMQFQQTALAARRLRTSMHTLEAALGEAQQALTALHHGGRRRSYEPTPTGLARERHRHTHRHTHTQTYTHM